MGPEESFDSLYQATRRRLVHQCFALTGDLPAAQAAVRDAYVAAWQHWRKVSRLEDPLDWVRPRAWQLAQRRHTARIWHRNKGLTEEHRAVLDGLSTLPSAQRRVLLLVVVAGLDTTSAARGLGVTGAVAERNLRGGTAALASELGVAEDAVPARLDALDSHLDPASLPRGPVVRRAGRKRRQGHAVVGATAAVVVALASGAFAYEPRAAAPADVRVAAPEQPKPSVPEPTAETPTAADLLDRDQIRRLGLAQPWRVVNTSDNTAGDGLTTECQQARFADPDGLSAVVRGFAATGAPRRSAAQTVEVSKSAAQARRAFRTTVGWYAGCRLGRLQVLNAYRVSNIGDEADVLIVRIWKRPVTTMTVAVARTGAVTTATIGRTIGAAPPPAPEITQSLADSVAMLCAHSGAADCAKRPTYRVVPPPPSGEEPGILAVADLPPVGRIARPWVGTTPTSARTNPSATTCDRADFAGSGAVRTRTRTYLVPGARVPDRFGLSETYGVFRSPAVAARFLDGVRGSVAGCEKRDLATRVGSEQRRTSARLDRSSWQLRTEVTDAATVRFRVGFVRVGRTVAQLTFAPSPVDDISDARFTSLLERAGDRLRELG